VSGGCALARILGCLACLAGLTAASRTAEASVQRFALLVGSNQGQAPDVALHYAESDAAKLGQVLRDLGGFEPADMVILRNEDANIVRSTLISLNDRIRAAESFARYPDAAVPSTTLGMLMRRRCTWRDQDCRFASLPSWCVGLPRPFDCWWSTPVVPACSPGSKVNASSLPLT